MKRKGYANSLKRTLCMIISLMLCATSFGACGGGYLSTSNGGDSSFISSEDASTSTSSKEETSGDDSAKNSAENSDTSSSAGDSGEVEPVNGELYNIVAASTYPGASNANQITFRFSNVTDVDNSTVNLGYDGWKPQDENTKAFKQYIKVKGQPLSSSAYLQGLDKADGLSLQNIGPLQVGDTITVEQGATFTNGDVTMTTAYKFTFTWGGQFYQTSKTFEDGIAFLQSKQELGVGYVADSNLQKQNVTGITYQSTNPAVATVDVQTGNVTAVGEGEAYIKATAMVNGQQKQSKYVVKVQPKQYSSLSGDEECIRWLGRTFTNERGVNCYTTASGIAVNFYGTQLKATITSTGISLPRLCVLVDGETDCTARMVDLSKTGSTAEYTLVQGLAEGNHTVYVHKVTEAQWTSLAFSSLKTDGYLKDSPKQKKYQFEVYGDSITAGLHSMKNAGTADPANMAEDYMQNGCITYAFKTAQAFDADLHVMARSGIGAYSSWGTSNPFNTAEEMSMLSMWDKSYVSESDFLGGTIYENPAWNFDNYKPDLVIINIGTNDVWYRWEENTYKTALTTLCNNLFTKYGNDLKIVLVSGMMVTDNASAVAEVQSTFARAGKAVIHERLNTSAKDHPGKQDHQTASELLTAAIRQAFGM